MAGALAREPGLRSGRGSVQAQVLLPRDVRVSLGPCPRGTRAQLHHRRRGGAPEAPAGLQRAAPVRVGRVRPAGGERRHQERHPSRDLHAREHRAHEGAVAAPRHQLRLGARAGHVPARLLPLEPVAVHPHVRARPGLSPPLDRELVSGRPHGAGQRAGRRRRLLALRHHGRAEGPGAVVLPHHGLRRRPAGERRRAVAVARQGAHDAAQLDRPIRGRARELRARRLAGRHRGLHDPHRHHLRRHVPDAGPGASPGRPVRRRGARSQSRPRPDRAVPRPGPRRPGEWRGGEGRLLHRPLRDQSLQRRTRAGLGRELRPRRIRHRRRDGRAVRRPARLRVRAQVRPADPRGDRSGRGRTRARRGRHDRVAAGGRAARELGRLRRAHLGGRPPAAHRRREGPRPRRRHGAVPPQGLGHLAAALLGHADSDDPLPAVRRGAGARRSAARGPAEGGAVHRPGRLAARDHSRVRQRRLPGVRRGRATRDRHDGHVRGLVVVLLPLRRRAQRPVAVRSRRR